MKLKLMEFRKAAGLNQTELAKKVGKSVRTIKMWEAGESYPNAEVLWQLCTVLNTDPDTMLGWETASAPASVTRDESLMLADYRACTPDRRRMISTMARDMAGASLECAGTSPPYEAASA